ncbi:hypothetical protein SCH01S_42_00790 [Sphingomonas changbaiensis NBRC 104936]|uniref:Uncharacterized protein n=1 Tax=Sphingomonas changbaiensis NBRC 104936 TaxID=1219043 RepID=A0A0E9MRI0_9SPHN|nr:hypothetical protein [Sphingomonas changbaiensis]GAO40036.1 hypothetical protein SCH01S_42_00790 [Sphingomonas changbaiensis NBRC 104936]
MAGIVITALFAISMWAAIWLLAGRKRRAEPPGPPGQLTPAERRRLYKRLGIDPVVMARQRSYGWTVARPRPDVQRKRSTRA